MTSLGNHGGYSGAKLWRIRTNQGEYCLRQWPVRPTQAKHLEWVHQVLNQIAGQGFPARILPLPYLSTTGSTLVYARECPYELSNWLPGSADYRENPNPGRIESAATTLARFHIAAKTLGKQQIPGDKLRGMIQRQKLICELNQGLAQKIESLLENLPFSELGRQVLTFYRSLEPVISLRLKQISTYNFDQQVCIRDIWHDHLFFEGNDVSGIVDFGAMDFDHFGTDISRLFGSLFQNETESWSAGFDAYRAINELSDLELELIEVYDRSNTMLAGMNWLKWILTENRKFDSYLPIIKRMELLVQRMRDWV